MALEGAVRNLYGPCQMGDLTVVLAKMSSGAGDAARIAAESSQDVSVDSGSHSGGVYIVSFPAGTINTVVGWEVLGSTRTASASLITTSAGVASITLTMSGGTILLASEQLHLTLLVAR